MAGTGHGGYFGRTPGDSNVVIAKQVHQPTGVQTDFTFASGYTPGYMDVYINGKPQKIENLVKIKEPHKNMWFCFNPNYSLSFILSSDLRMNSASSCLILLYFEIFLYMCQNLA